MGARDTSYTSLEAAKGLGWFCKSIVLHVGAAPMYYPAARKVNGVHGTRIICSRLHKVTETWARSYILMTSSNCRRSWFKYVIEPLHKEFSRWSQQQTHWDHRASISLLSPKGNSDIENTAISSTVECKFRSKWIPFVHKKWKIDLSFRSQDLSFWVVSYTFLHAQFECVYAPERTSTTGCCGYLLGITVGTVTKGSDNTSRVFIHKYSASTEMRLARGLEVRPTEPHTCTHASTIHKSIELPPLFDKG